MTHIVPIDNFPSERVSLLAQDMKHFMSLNEDLCDKMLADTYAGNQSVEFYRGLVTANDYAAGMERNAQREITPTYKQFFSQSAASAYVLERIVNEERDVFKTDHTKINQDTPIELDQLKQIVPKDAIYDYSELFMGDKSDDFYTGLIKGYDSATLLAQRICRDSNTHVQLDLITMFVAYKILEKSDEQPLCELLSPKKWVPEVISNGGIRWKERERSN